MTGATKVLAGYTRDEVRDPSSDFYRVGFAIDTYTVPWESDDGRYEWCMSHLGRERGEVRATVTMEYAWPIERMPLCGECASRELAERLEFAFAAVGSRYRQAMGVTP